MGADDYIVKPFSSAEVISRIRAVLRRTGGTRARPPVIRVGGLEIDESARSTSLDGEPVSLTRKSSISCSSWRATPVRWSSGRI